MKRWAANLFCLFSLLVFVSSVTIWVRSYFVNEYVGYMTVRANSTRRPVIAGDDLSAIGCSRGAVVLRRNRCTIRGAAAYFHGWQHVCIENAQSLVEPPSLQDNTNIAFAGFQILDRAVTYNADSIAFQALVVPLWLFLPAAVPPFLWWRKWRKRDTRGFEVSKIEVRNSNDE